MPRRLRRQLTPSAAERRRVKDAAMPPPQAARAVSASVAVEWFERRGVRACEQRELAEALDLLERLIGAFALDLIRPCEDNLP